MKTFIGNGKASEKFQGAVKVTIAVEKFKDLIYDYNGKKYLTFDVTPLREVDKFGKTHSVSVWQPDKQNNNDLSGSVSIPNSDQSDQLSNAEPFDDSSIPF